MATRKPRVYIDACCYIDVAKGRLKAPVKPGEEGRDQEVWFIESLLIAAFNEEIEIFGSTLLIAECLFTEDKTAISDEAKEIFQAVLESGNPVKLSAPDLFVCERARDLLWEDGILCGGSADQAHVATALLNGCEEFITTNKKKGPLRVEVAAKLAALGLRVVRPDQTAVLPPDYMKPLFATKQTAPEESTKEDTKKAAVDQAADDVSDETATAIPDASTASALPASQSRGDESPKAGQPEPGPPSAPQGDPEPPPQGSSPPVLQPPPSKQ